MLPMLRMRRSSFSCHFLCCEADFRGALNQMRVILAVLDTSPAKTTLIRTRPTRASAGLLETIESTLLIDPAMCLVGMFSPRLAAAQIEMRSISLHESLFRCFTVGFDHGAGHPLLFLDDAKVPNCRKNNGFMDLGNYSEWPKVAGAVIKASPCLR